MNESWLPTYQYELRNDEGELLGGFQKDQLESVVIPYAKRNNCTIIDCWHNKQIIFPIVNYDEEYKGIEEPYKEKNTFKRLWNNIHTLKLLIERFFKR